ncbi:hypothetical protein [Halorussus sp. MSC15.2]|uniref:hypothetical protein n=1 Tax=Halorussus sp. MSC15.2 TaxID=2283638 RepID=UPI0013D1F9BC|nr:hypothetical protein [Halorussus sp. MSC15.2]NEU59192.1 hypothetical protein [Halorussus sp. MSC15.2]
MSYPIEGTPHHEEVLFEVIQAASSFADRFVLSIETGIVADDYPSIIQELDDNFSQTSGSGAVRYEAHVSESSLEVIKSLLEMTGGARVFGIRKIELVRDSETCLRYVPDHEDFTMNGDSSGDIIDAVQNAIDVEPAVVLPNHLLVEWEVTGTECSISPPSLCIGNVCYGLSRLASVEPRPEQLEIELRWYEPEQGQLGQAISWAASKIGLSRPDTLRFESTAELSDAVEILQTVTAGTGKDVL